MGLSGEEREGLGNLKEKLWRGGFVFLSARYNPRQETIGLVGFFVVCFNRRKEAS